MSVIFIDIIAVYTCLYIIFKIVSRVEKINIIDNNQAGYILERTSLRVFKICRNITLALAASEIVLCERVIDMKYRLLLLVIFFSGVALRLIAIRSLGIYWSYHVELRNDHKVIRHGIYKYIKHPAYIGNIFIPALYALIGSFQTSILSVILVILFYCYRSDIENTLLNNISNCTYLNEEISFEPN